MKKKNQLLWLLPLVFLSYFFLSCDPENSNTKNTVTDIQYLKNDYTLFELGRLEGLDEDTEWQILQAYLKKLKSGVENADLTINDVWVEKYFGVYCPPYGFGAYSPPYGNIWESYKTYEDDWDRIYYAPENQTVFAMLMGAYGYNNGNEQQEVSIRHERGRAFVKNGDSIFLWNNRKLYNLEDYLRNDLLFNWDFFEIANMQNGLDIETLRKIHIDWVKSLHRPDYPELQLPVRRYYEIPMHYLGIYNGYIVVFVYCGTNASVFHLEIDGVHFYHSNSGHYIIAWKEGKIYMLQDLYEQNLITHEDLVIMAYNFYAIKEGE
jgi:hypothetical protein